MASALYSEDLTCSVCLSLFTDPVTVPCGHSFCRQCITDVVTTQAQCPQCRTAVSTQTKCLPTNVILRSLAEKAREAERTKTEVTELCPEHEEKLKLFCITDQQLACIICRDGEKHEGHKFKPIKEAAASLKKELETLVQHISDDVQAVDSLADTQRAEMRKTREKSQQLMMRISRQFEEMHQFLRKREDEIKNELRHKEEDDVERMSEVLNSIETALSESRELEVKATSALEITDPEKFLKSWTEENKEQPLRRPEKRNLSVVTSSLCLGPYESHLQFFVWKEMLQVIQPRAELLSLRSNNQDVTVSDDGRSLFSTPETGNDAASVADPYSYNYPPGFHQRLKQARALGRHANRNAAFGFGVMQPMQPTYSPPSFSTAFSVSEFTSEQHYWEVEVGKRDYWELGIQDHLLKYDGQTYTTCGPNMNRALPFEKRPRKIGIYLNCLSKKLSFYDADDMTHIGSVTSAHMSLPVSACFRIRPKLPDCDPVTVCWY